MALASTTWNRTGLWWDKSCCLPTQKDHVTLLSLCVAGGGYVSPQGPVNAMDAACIELLSLSVRGIGQHCGSPRAEFWRSVLGGRKRGMFVKNDISLILSGTLMISVRIAANYVGH